jgi:hypothetical protein
VNRVKAWLAVLLLAITALPTLALAVSTTITEGVSAEPQNSPYQAQQSTDPVLVDSTQSLLSQQGAGSTGSVTYDLTVIEPEKAIEEEKSGVPVTGPSPEVLIPPPPSPPPSEGFPHGYITIPWWLVEYVRENWWALALLALLAIVLYVYKKRREGVKVEIEIPRWAY